MKTQSLPISLHTNGTQTFQVDLQLRAAVEFNAPDSASSFGISGGASVGAYVNLVEFVAELESTHECQLQSLESANLNIGVYGGAKANVSDLAAGSVPSASTTLFSANMGTQCRAATGVPLQPRTPAAIPTQECHITPYEQVPTTTTSPVDVSRATGDVGMDDLGPATTAPLGSAVVMTVTACASPLINCPEDLALALEMTQAICPQPHAATITDSCFAADATNAVPMTSLISAITASVGPVSLETGCAAEPASHINRTMTRQSASGTRLATRPTQAASPSGLRGPGSGNHSESSRNGSATGTGPFVITPTSMPSTTSLPTVVSIGGSGTSSARSWCVCWMALANIATILALFW